MFRGWRLGAKTRRLKGRVAAVRFILFWLVLLCTLCPTPSAAEDLPVPGLSSPIEIHGFVSQGFIWSAKNEYLAKSKGGSFEFNETALNFTNQVTDSLRMGFQLLAHDLGPMGNYKPQFDWFYLDYQYRDWLGFRAGRIKMPFGLFNEVQDIDVARVPILLPQSIYQSDHREYAFAQSGLTCTDARHLARRARSNTACTAGDCRLICPIHHRLASRRPTLASLTFSVVACCGLPPLDGLAAALSGQVLRLIPTSPSIRRFLLCFKPLVWPVQRLRVMFELQFLVSRWVAFAALQCLRLGRICRV